MSGDSGDSMEPAPDAVEVAYCTDSDHVWGDNSMVMEEIEETSNATDPAHLREDVIFNATQVTGKHKTFTKQQMIGWLSFIDHHPSFPTDDMYFCKSLGLHFVSEFVISSGFHYHPIVSGGWSYWSNWSNPGGSSQQTRYRSCSQPQPSCGGQQCYGRSTETRYVPSKYDTKLIMLNALCDV